MTLIEIPRGKMGDELEKGIEGKKREWNMHSAIISSLVAKSSSNDEMATGIDRQNNYAKRNSV